MSEKRGDARTTIARGLLAASVLVCAMGLGGLSRWTLGASLLLSTASFFVAWSLAPLEGGARRAATALALLALGLTCFSVLQCVPLPMGLLRAVAPANADAWGRAFAAFREPAPTSSPISLDPTATTSEVARGALYLLTFLATLRLAERREGMRFLSMAIMGTAVLLGLAALLHPALGAERVFGIYAPVAVRSGRHVAPILNPNALADFINIGFALALSDLFSKAPGMPRPVSLAVTLLLLVVQLWIASRGGVVAMFLAVALLLWIHRAAKDSRATATPTLVLLGVVVVASTVMIVLASSSDAFDEVADTDFSKLAMHRAFLPLVRVFAATGMGRGAFESVAPAYRNFGTGYIVMTHPENVILQWLTEWGIVVGVAGLGVIAYTLRPATALARRSETFGSWVALAVVAVHNLLDLGSEVPANVLALAIAAGIVTSGSGQARGKIDRWRLHTKGVRAGAAGLAALGLGALVVGAGHDLHEDREELRRLAVDASVDKPAFYGSLHAAIARHPAEPYFPYLGALRAAAPPSEKTEMVTAWVARTLERSPVHGLVHLVLARALVVRAPAQARVEFRLAATQEPSVAVALSEAAPLVRSYEDAMELLPTGSARNEVAWMLVKQLEHRLPATTWRLVESLLESREAESDSRAVRAKAFVGDVVLLESYCDGAKDACFQRAKSEVDRLSALRPTSCKAAIHRLDLELASGLGGTAFAQFTKEIDRLDERSVCLSEAIQRAHDARAKEEIGLVDQLARAGCATTAECTRNLVIAANFETAAGRSTRALAFIKTAIEKDPANDELAERAAMQAAALGMHREAVDLLRRLTERFPERADLRETRAREERAVAESTVRPGVLK